MSQDADQAEQAIAKTLRLRGAPVPVARVSRRALVVVGAVLIAGIAGALGWSLMERRKAAPPEPRLTTAPPPETVTALPRGYVGAAGTPVLGPPLPGDLGRPMLSAARARQADAEPAAAAQAEGAPAVGGAAGGAPTMVDPMAEARREARRAAIQSGLFVVAVGRGVSQAAQVAAIAQDAAGAEAGAPGASDARLTSAERLQAPASPYVLQVGAVIPAALVTGLRSDVPGLAIAQVTQDVFDSLGGGYLLIPKGSRLTGAYDVEIKNGQSRLRVEWTRLTLPSGKSIVLDKLPGADEQGMAGLQDGV
ncbi:conjugal transfer protein TrbI, partial [Caulobacter zeae]